MPWCRSVVEVDGIVAKPCALLLDRWLGKEGINYFSEQDLHSLIRRHVDAGNSEVGRLEATGAINFLKLDDVRVDQLGEVIDPLSVVELPFFDSMPLFPEFECRVDDEFLQRVGRSRKKWVVIVDPSGTPRMALNTTPFFSAVLFSGERPKPLRYCHRPIVVTDATTQLGQVLTGFRVDAQDTEDDVINNDLILLWGAQQRVITGTDILGRLMRDIAGRDLRANTAFAV
jgi:metal transporter CNNM